MAVTSIKTNKKSINASSLKPYNINEDLKSDNIDQLLSYIMDEVDECDGYVNLKYEKSGCLKFTFSELASCCAIAEIGNIEYTPFNGDLEFIDKLGLLYKGRTLIINLNNNAHCTRLSKLMTKCKNWTKVKRFVNKNTKNPIEIWMSNNE